MSTDSTEKLPSTRKRCLTADARRAMMDDAPSAKIRRNIFVNTKIESVGRDRSVSMREYYSYMLQDVPTPTPPWTSSSFWQPSTITTSGIPNLRMCEHPLGLAQVIFDNCVVKVRDGFDLNNLLSLGRLGHVDLFNVTSFGWVATDRTLLPCCIFARWISSMQAAV